MRSEIKTLKNSKILWYGISTLIILGLIHLADLGKFLDALRSVDPLYMSLAFVIGLSVLFVWGYIWHSFFKQLGIKSSLSKSLKLFLAGNFMNSVTPFGQLGGEPVMAYIVSRNTEASYEKSISTVISADIINAIPFLTFATAGIMYLVLFRTITSTMQTSIYLVVILNLILITIGYLVWFNTSATEKKIQGLLDAIESRFESTRSIVKPLKVKIRTLSEVFEKIGEEKRHLAKVTAITHLAPVTQFICLYLILLGMEVSVSFIAIYFTVILAGLAMFSPTPGGTGTFEAAFSGLLILFNPGLALDTAVAAAVLFRLTTYWPGILIGYAAMISLKRGREP